MITLKSCFEHMALIFLLSDLVGAQTLKTSEKEETLNPVWNETFEVWSCFFNNRNSIASDVS